MSLGAYEVFLAENQSADPEWPGLPFFELLKIASKGRIIDGPDHPVMQKLRGSAELGCHLSLHWPMPARILDLFTEFRNLTNGLDTLVGSSWRERALAHYGLDGIGATEKTEMRVSGCGSSSFCPKIVGQRHGNRRIVVVAPIMGQTARRHRRNEFKTGLLPVFQQRRCDTGKPGFFGSRTSCWTAIAHKDPIFAIFSPNFVWISSFTRAFFFCRLTFQPSRRSG